MLLDKSKIKQILDIIKKRHNLFVVKVLGRDLLSDAEISELKEEFGEDAINQVKDLIASGYYAGYMRNSDHGTVDKTSLAQFENEKKPLLSDYEQYSVEHAKEVVNSYVQKLSQNTRTNFEQLIREYNKIYKDKMMTQKVLPLVIQAQEEQKSVGQLILDMRDLTGDMTRDWERIAKTEITNVLNAGMVDKIAKQNPDKSPRETYVFKRIINDSHTCPVCRRLHLMPDGVTPRVYRLSDVMSNGTNIGKKSSEWDMVIGAVHPNCRCTLSYLSDGYHFDEHGKMVYVGEKESKERLSEHFKESEE